MSETNSSSLPGLPPIREALGLSQGKLATLAGSVRSTIWRIETGSETSMPMGRKLAEILSCELTDLLSVPTPERLAEIRAAYTRKVADEAEAQAKLARANAGKKARAS